MLLKYWVSVALALQVYTAVPAALQDIPPLIPNSYASGAVRGEWTQRSAGGCSNSVSGEALEIGRPAHEIKILFAQNIHDLHCFTRDRIPILGYSWGISLMDAPMDLGSPT